MTQCIGWQSSCPWSPRGLCGRRTSTYAAWTSCPSSSTFIATSPPGFPFFLTFSPTSTPLLCTRLEPLTNYKRSNYPLSSPFLHSETDNESGAMSQPSANLVANKFKLIVFAQQPSKKLNASSTKLCDTLLSWGMLLFWS